ncbi:MAG: SDR family NAD(P)-dependent oxidoreductase [Bacilli bacterium]|nr:SDR family NAD(P)-dependent oxidoreductase [Mollicutes bacterium]MDY3898702.1 SDR family NAD(P)-dependent oxidoreductase [Bacilli bacterium]
MKYVIVTGALGGMGKATTLKLLENGYYVIGLDKCVNEEIKHNNLSLIVCDVTNEENIKNAYNQVLNITNEIDAIIHFAGMYLMDSLVEISYQDLDKIFKVNFFGVYLINKTFIPLLKKGGRIITTTSELAPLDPLPFTGIYAITKSTLDKYCYSLRMELQLLDIKVSVVRAGAVKTAMLGSSIKSLEEFCNKTKLYSYNAKKFKEIVNKVETKNIEPSKLACKVQKILEKKNPKFAYKINANFYLRLLSKMPKKFQFWVIKKVLKKDK